MGYRVDAYGVEDKLNLTQINVCGFFLQCSNCGGIKMKKGMPPDLVRPRGLPIIVPQGLVLVDIPSNLSKYYGTKDEDPSRHMGRFIERVITSLITNQQYWLVSFPTTLEGEPNE